MALNEDMTVSQLKREITGALTEAVGAGEAAAVADLLPRKKQARCANHAHRADLFISFG